MNLDLGAQRPRPGCTTVDLDTADLRCDLGQFPWPLPTAGADRLNASHVLEHFIREQGVLFLRECRRILRPGGWLRIAVPDLDKFIDCHLTGSFASLGGYIRTDLNDLMGGGLAESRPEWRHYYAYCFASLAYTLAGVGFTDITRSAYGVSQDAGMVGIDTEEYQAISLYVESRRPEGI